MKKYLLILTFLGLCFSNTPLQAMQMNRVLSPLPLPIRFISNNLYPLVFWGTAGFIGVYAAKKLFNYWRDRERMYEIDEMTKVVINTWPYAAPREYIAAIINSKTNQEYGNLIYQVQAAGVVYIRRLVIEPEYRQKKYGSKLLKIVLSKLPSLHNCSKVTVYAMPIELRAEETIQQILPKLIGFYQKQGAQITQIGNNGTWMEFDLTKQT